MKKSAKAFNDAFAGLARPSRTPLIPPRDSGHSVRAHSKYSASGSERWFECSGSVALSEGLPDKTSAKAEIGTRAHEILERIARNWIAGKSVSGDGEMFAYSFNAAQFMIELHKRTRDSEFMVETRIKLDFIHPEMFGTFDGAVVDHFGILHVFDYKYGTHAISPIRNLQMLFYGIGLAYIHHWNFKRARLWIIQPRVRSYEGPIYWELPILELKGYVEEFKRAVERVEKHPDRFKEGSWCYFCKARTICPLKQEGKLGQARDVFSRAEIKS